ncbi:MAG TPA: disulfide bond formation protein B [Vicinamibacterales bacterium]
MSRSPLYTVLAAAVLFLILVPLGTSVFILGFIHGDSPCILCWAQRIGMSLIALIGLFILRYGPRPKYVGLGVLVGAWGMFMAVRHSSLHLARDIGQGFAIQILGAHTYVWSFAVFFVCVVVMALMLIEVPIDDMKPGPPRRLAAIDRFATVTFLVVIAGTMVQAFASTGPPPFVGQSDPVRFSFRPSTWVWSLDEFSSAPISLRGRWNVELPDVTRVDGSPSTALGTLPELAASDRTPLPFAIAGTPTGLAYDANRFLLTTEHGVYLVDDALQAALRYTVVDPLFSVDLGRFADAAFLDGGRLLAITENKSYVVLKEAQGADARKNYRYFLENPTAFDEIARSRFATLRAKMMYVMAAAVDPATHAIYTVTVPNARTKRWVISRFDPKDMLLSEEFVPAVSPTLSTPKEGTNPLDDFYVTAATIANGRMFALSAAHNTLLTIDLASHAVVAAHTVTGISQPTGMALKGGRLFIVCRDGSIASVVDPSIMD